MTAYERLKQSFRRRRHTWLVTGAAGFIGSHLVEALLQLNQRVVGLDNFATSTPRNLHEVKNLLTRSQWKQFRFVEGDILDFPTCRRVCRGAEFVLHQAALGSVPRSIRLPIETNRVNVEGTLNVLIAARDQGAKRVVHASSCSIYGDLPELPKRESSRVRPLSPYAATKLFNEVYADVFARCYGVEIIGLRYFNVFGPRQDPNGAYAAVIPRWISTLVRGGRVRINGDGRTSRDFCYVENVVQANLLAAATKNPRAVNQVLNVALSERTSLNKLFRLIRDRLAELHPALRGSRPAYASFREGDIRHSRADVGRARRLLGYSPTHTLAEGLDASLNWYLKRLA